MLNSDNKPIARAPANKENDKPTKRTDDKVSIFSQAPASATKKDLLEKFDNSKRGPMSSATTVSTVAQS